MKIGNDDRVFLHVSFINGVMRYGKRDKLSMRNIGLFEILSTFREFAYELALPLNFLAVHPIFHVSILQCNIPDKTQVLYGGSF